jgi:hypothetical protein
MQRRDPEVKPYTGGEFRIRGSDRPPKRESVAKPSRLMVATDWRPVEKGTLRGFFSLRLPSGIRLRDCALHSQGDSRWIGLPGKPQIDAEGRHRIDPATGKKAYTPTVEISRERREAFQAQALAAVDVMLEGEP